MKNEELAKKDNKELEMSVLDLKKRLSDIRFRFSSSKVKNTQEIKNIKKEIARLLTIIRENSK